MKFQRTKRIQEVQSIMCLKLVQWPKGRLLKRGVSSVELI